ncbi:MAG: 50S ribosomal protein L3 [Candidatus Omnitrophica bacterium]|nr:50S ribosomal protein L3 [Candidatus Omnitrophota bacterium]
MMIGLLGKKVGMTVIYDEGGTQIPVTLLLAGPCRVLRILKKEKSGYSAVQLGFGARKQKNVTQPVLGQFKKLGLPAQAFVREIRTEEVDGLEVGTELGVDNFEAGEFVDIEGVSIGKGFQGVVKRHHFTGGNKTHGSMFGRVAGSIGASSFPSRVVKGMRMPGQMGNHRVTVQNLKVVKVDPENHLLAVKGAVPGSGSGFVVIRTSLKRGKAKKWKVEQKQELSPEPAKEVVKETVKEGSAS